MAERRMFTKKITDGDEFTEMPPTAQCLYFHLCMSADDDGFSNHIRIAMFNAHASTDDFNTLIAKKFIIPFESGVIVIKHWKMHNYIQNDRYHATKYVEEKASLLLKKNGVYTMDTGCIQDVYKVDTEVRLGKVRLGKVSVSREDTPTLEEVKAYIADNNYKCDADKIFNYYTSKNWEGVKNWKARIDLWEKDDKQRRSNEIEQYDYDFDELERLLISNG